MAHRLTLVYKLDSGDPAFLSSFYPLVRIREACLSRGIELGFSLSRDVEADFPSFLDGAAGHRVWLRGDLPEGLLGRLADSGLDCFNPARAISRVRDKRFLADFLSSRGVPAPRSFDPRDRAALAANLPVIAKPRRGMMGRGVRLVEGEAELDALLSGPVEDLVFQEYVRESRGKDYRVFTCRGRALAVVRRESAGLLSNAHSGGLTRAAELPARWTDLSGDLAREAGLEYAAVDFLERGPEDFLVCEINTVPGFEALEKASGVDIAGAVIDACLGAGA